MKVVILCGGLGTRLREETEHRPKPMVPVGGRPLVWHVMKLYAHYGQTEFVLCLGYRGDTIKDYFLNYEALNNDFTICLGRQTRLEYHGEHDEQQYRVTLAETGQNTMTGGRVKRVARYLDGDTFLLTYGDGVANLDVDALLKFHRSHGRLGTVTAVRPISRFGLVELEPDGRVQRFSEKPQEGNWISAGFFVFERPMLDYLSEASDCVLEHQLERLARDQQLVAYRHDGFFWAMDTYRDYLYLNELWNGRQAAWAVWEARGEHRPPDLSAVPQVGPQRPTF